MLPKFNFIESIGDVVETYLLFETCNTCESIVWYNTLGSLDCSGSHNGLSVDGSNRCKQCLDKYKYERECDYNDNMDQCPIKYCRQCMEEYSRDDYDLYHVWPKQCYGRKYRFCGSHDPTTKLYEFDIWERGKYIGCTQCIGSKKLESLICSACERYFCDKCLVYDLHRDCYESGSYVSTVCNQCLDESLYNWNEWNPDEHGFEISKLGLIIPGQNIVVCTTCIINKDTDFALCDLCKKMFDKENMISDITLAETVQC